LEDTHTVSSGKVCSNGEVGIGTAGYGSVESSPVKPWKISLRLELPERRVQVVVNLVDITQRERGLFTQTKILAIFGHITRTTKSWLSHWKGERRGEGILLSEAHSHQTKEK